MNTPDPVVAQELPLIHKILADEIWLEGERRRQAVDRADPVVLARVCDIILATGADMRESILRRQAAARTLGGVGGEAVRASG